MRRRSFPTAPPLISSLLIARGMLKAFLAPLDLRYAAENWQRRVLAYPSEHQTAINEGVALMRSYQRPFQHPQRPCQPRLAHPKRKVLVPLVACCHGNLAEASTMKAGDGWRTETTPGGMGRLQRQLPIRGFRAPRGARLVFGGLQRCHEACASAVASCFQASVLEFELKETWAGAVRTSAAGKRRSIRTSGLWKGPCPRRWTASSWERALQAGEGP